VDLMADIGRISRYTVEALAARGIQMEGEPRYPKPLTLTDLASADLVVAVKEAEHRAMMADQFPQWVDRIEYWHIDDLDCAGPEQSLPVLESAIRALVVRLSANATEGVPYRRKSCEVSLNNRLRRPFESQPARVATARRP